MFDKLMNLARRGVAVVKENAGKLVAVAAVAIGFAAAPQAEAAIITYDAATNAVTFTPGDLVTPIVTGVIAVVGAASVLVIISVGVRWLYRMIKGSK